MHMAIAVWEWGAYYGDAKMKGAKLDISKWKRPSPETIPSQAKAAGLYMICTMSKHAAEAKGCSDAIMMDYRGYVAEATGANVFFVKDGEVHTPEPDCFLNGITRQTVMQMLKERGVRVNERHIEPHEMADFQQCWLTGTAAEVTPVGAIGDVQLRGRRADPGDRRRLREAGPRPARDGVNRRGRRAVVTHRIIIDTDPGQDDAIAILLALASPEIEVLGICSVAGNVPLRAHHPQRPHRSRARRPDRGAGPCRRRAAAGARAGDRRGGARQVRARRAGPARAEPHGRATAMRSTSSSRPCAPSRRAR